MELIPSIIRRADVKSSCLIERDCFAIAEARTTAIPEPHAAVTSDQRWSEWSDSNRHRKAWKACMPPLHHTRTIGSAYRYRTGPSTLATWDACLHTQAEQTSAARRRSDILQLSKTLLVSSWRQRQDSNPDP